jgi:phenylalanyl-tRNA synthetase beta chain
MIITLSWLKNHLNTQASLNKIIESLTNIGLEVENVKENQNNLNDFKIAKILNVEKHPNADKLKLCDVDLGESKKVKVVCGAANARKNLLTIYASPGSVIPKTKKKLKIVKIRGVESHGMLCSEAELNMSDESEGIIELKNKDNMVGKNFFKSGGEKAIDIAVTPNRPDCLGVRGIARDLASFGIGKLKSQPPIKLKEKFRQSIKVSIKKEKDQGCGTFGSVYIKNVKNKESPEWLKKKIISLGLKPISAIVDTTNYVMFDLNRPLHAYDADKINKEIIVRNSKKGETFEALDNKKYTLQNGMCVITDKSGVLGLGGIIGGARSGTELSTKNILLESAYFHPDSIRKTAKKLNINTDAKFRFERGIDPNSIESGLKLATCMILDICGGESSKISITGNKKNNNKSIILKSGTFEKIIGTSISSNEIKKILSSLGFKVKISKNQYKVEVPSWRPDINQEIDLVEELIRIKGFDKIKIIAPEKIRNQDTLNYKQKLFHLSQRAIASKGYLETVTWSFTDAKVDQLFNQGSEEIGILNPISSDLNVLRRSIFSNICLHLKRNQDRGYEDLGIFEVGPIFFGKQPGQQLTVAGGVKTGLIGRKSWIDKPRKLDVFDIKSDVIRTLFELNLKETELLITKEAKNYYHPGRSGSICLKSDKKKTLAYFGEIHPAIITTLDFKEKNVFGFEVFLDNIPESRNKIRNNKAKYKVSDYQKTERDFAFVIDKNYSANEIEILVKNVNPDLIQSVKTFDVFEGQNLPEGKKSLAINVILQSESKTLTDSDLEQISNKIIETVKEKTGATIRS